MVIYARTWRGKKEPGSRISAWDPIVAELPDLSDMISQTYVNEVDISKVQEGQDVKIQVDAFPDRSYTGKVIKVANIGEQLSGYDAKVFEVIVQVNEADSILRPAMTTSNEIITGTYEDILAIPLEGLQSDSLTFVYKDGGSGVVRQEIVTSLASSDEIMVEYGLSEGDIIFLVPPPGAEEAPFVPLDPATKALMPTNNIKTLVDDKDWVGILLRIETTWQRLVTRPSVGLKNEDLVLPPPFDEN